MQIKKACGKQAFLLDIKNQPNYGFAGPAIAWSYASRGKSAAVTLDVVPEIVIRRHCSNSRFLIRARLVTDAVDVVSAGEVVAAI